MFSNQEQGSLIEDWGPRVVSADVAMELEKKVTFSEFSYRRVYTSVPYYEACKSYTSADRKRFKDEAISDGFRIRHLISLFRISTGRAVKELLKQGLITSEDLLGIEHFCSDKLAEKALNNRLSYTNLVLRAQEELRRNGLVDAEKLAAIATAGSLGCVEKAKYRAILALD